MFGKIVLDVPGELFEEALHDLVEKKGVSVDTELTAEDLAGLVETFKAIVKDEAGVEFPTDPQEQLAYAIDAVFKSWNGRRAKDYRRMEKIPDDLGTAVNVQTMVFGNKGDDSGTGVAFTRNPSTGEHKPYGDFLEERAGRRRRRRHPHHRAARRDGQRVPRAAQRAARRSCSCSRTTSTTCATSSSRSSRVSLFMLQTRVGKRTAAAALRMAVEMVDEGLIDRTEAVLRVQPAQLDQLLHPQFDPKAKFTVLAKGLNASPGAAVGKVYFTADDAEARHEAGERVILVRPETSPDDLHGMIAAEGILTSRGGLVSHAAVVARGMGKPAICGAEAVKIDLAGRTFTAGGTTVQRRRRHLDQRHDAARSSSARSPVITPEPSGPFGIILGWADELRTLKVRTNADLPEDARKAREFGAEGIGLCRTEHMFLGDRLPIVQRMILADTPDDEASALEELRAQQEADFEGILEAMDGLPVTVRLLDPPLHEFLPDHEELIVKQAKGEITDRELKLLHASELWRESNPMLGTRGCRLGIIKPGLYRMQVRALMQAAVTRRAKGGNPIVEIMIPLIVSEPELKLLETVDARRGRQGAARGERRDRLPRRHDDRDAARRARRRRDRRRRRVLLVRHQRPHADDVRVLPRRHRGPLHERVPRVQAACRRTRSRRSTSKASANSCAWAARRAARARPGIKLGICGEHGGDPASVAFCHEVGLDYVSCSPYRVPIARLAAAHAAVGTGGPGASA